MNEVNDFEQYFQKTNDALANKWLINFLKSEKVVPKTAIDIGCGAGRDSIFLIRNAWNVIGADRENVEELVREKLNKEENINFTFIQQSLEKLNLEENSAKLVNAMWTLSFCQRTKFDKMWKQVCNCLENDGYFVGNFFGKNDEWNVEGTIKSFFTEQEVKSLFNDFEIIKFNHMEEDGKTAVGQNKHWDVYFVVAKKVN